MNARRLTLTLTLTLLALALVAPLAGREGGGIIVDNADTIRTDAVVVDSDLLATAAAVTPRIIAEYANALRIERLANVPAALQSLLDQVAERITVEFANATRTDALVDVPAALQSLFDQVADRIVVEFANANRTESLAYPLELIDDTTPPTGSNIGTEPAGGGTAVTWSTSEWADSEVRYGTQPGSYTTTVYDPLYVQEHAVTLTSVIPGVTYYYRVRSTDLSGNTWQSSEYSFTAQISVYVPFITH